MKKNSFWSALEQKAEEIGFSEIAAAPITPLKKEAEYLEKWLEEGNAADMEYLQKTKAVRKNPELFLPGVQSVLMGTVSYYQDYQGRKNTGKIARYAAGRDYHKVMRSMLRQLAEFLQTECFPESTAEDFRISLDVHPVMERAWARRTELGFIGKNACLITEKAGSWVMLGGIFTTQKIPLRPSILRNGGVNAPVNNSEKKKKVEFSKLSCGNCTRCITACPTGAIVAPGKIDARKCISYLTIENKGGIPEELREKIGDRLFGCDICQEVCPFNIPRQSRFAKASQDKKPKSPLLETEIAGTEILISEILEIDSDEQFLQRFAGSPLMRAKRKGLLRNACVVAGNLGNKRFLPLLQKVEKREKDEMLREHAVWAIKKIMLSQ